jgi:thiamine pyrophosphate-dependent acetolactate synthase large subunit-like protein
MPNSILKNVTLELGTMGFALPQHLLMVCQTGKWLQLGDGGFQMTIQN